MNQPHSKSRRDAFFYIFTMSGLLGVIYYTLYTGRKLEAPLTTTITTQEQAPTFLSELLATLSQPLPIFILQLVLILVTARIFAFLFSKAGQPAVMGEIVAGIVLGPSVVGGLFPAFQSYIFPAHSVANLQMLSQVGLILFMFVVGMELDMSILKRKARSAVIISHASIVLPYGLGVALSYFLYSRFAPEGTPFHAFALFMGIAMSITAFPVLARVIREKGLSGTRLGTIAITCAAADDITAWCVLAVVVAIVKSGTVHTALFTLAITLAYLGIMLLLVKPLLKRLVKQQTTDTILKRSSLALIFVVLLLSAWCCEIIGIHALFGAFMAGVIMPPEWNFRKLIISKIEDVALVLLLPLFFVFTGLRTQIGLLNDASLWLTCLTIILVAVAGKFGGSALAARVTGETPRDSLAIGALMNTRGLMELVVLHIGYELNILSPEIFTMMVLMALVTTFMTSPLLRIILKKKRPD